MKLGTNLQNTVYFRLKKIQEKKKKNKQAKEEALKQYQLEHSRGGGGREGGDGIYIYSFDISKCTLKKPIIQWENFVNKKIPYLINVYVFFWLFSTNS